MDWSWQTIATKRPRPPSPQPNTTKKSKDVNRYALLGEVNNDSNKDANDEAMPVEDNNNNDQPVVSIKPPPIIFPNVTDSIKMLRCIRDEIGDEFFYKITTNGDIRLMVKHVSDYRKLIKALDNAGTVYHTYQIKSERSFRVVIKGLHSTTPVETIEAYLTFRDHKVRNIKNAISKLDKRPLNMFFIDLEPSPNNKDIYNIVSLDNALIKIEPVRKFDDLVQCFRCQEFGHTQKYCKKGFRCVKCSLGHPTSTCTKEKDASPKCVHCNNSHTANYKGCSVYQQIIKIKNHKSLPNNRLNPSISYAQAARGSLNIDHNNVNNNHFNTRDNNNINSNNSNNNNSNNETLIMKIEQMIKTQNEFMNTMMNMIQTVINALCK